MGAPGHNAPRAISGSDEIHSFHCFWLGFVVSFSDSASAQAEARAPARCLHRPRVAEEHPIHALIMHKGGVGIASIGLPVWSPARRWTVQADDSELSRRLFNDSSESNRPDHSGSTYDEAVLEQYKLYVEMADRISARRGLTNTFS